MDIEMHKLVATNLRNLRNAFGYTQAEIADELHISRSTYTLYELGKKFPGADTLIDLASFYNIRLELLVDSHAGEYLHHLFSEDKCKRELFQLIETYYQLSPHAQGKLIERAEVLLEKEEHNPIILKKINP